METSRHCLNVDRSEINYLRLIIESYDGMAVVKTINPEKAVIELLISPGCEKMIFELLESLRKNEEIEVTPCNIRGSE